LNIQRLPDALPHIDADAIRQRLAGLIDPQANKEEWYQGTARQLAIQFVSKLPLVFGSKLDRLTMWDKIAAAIHSGYAKTVSGDLDLFVQHVLESIQAEPTRAISCEAFCDAIDALHTLPEDQRQDWLQYLVTHLIPVLVHARREHKQGVKS
jgi:hypothetical protein